MKYIPTTLADNAQPTLKHINQVAGRKNDT